MARTKNVDGLTDKQRLALKAYIDPSSSSYLNKQQSVAKYYKTTYKSQSVIANETITDGNLEKLSRSCPELVIDPNLTLKCSKDWLITKLLEMIDTKSRDKNITIKSIELIAKLTQQLRDSNPSVEINITDTITERDLDTEFKLLTETKTLSLSENNTSLSETDI